MPKIITLNTDRDTVKRLVLDDDGATLQAFTRTGRVEIHLTAEELELVRTSCLLPDCDCPGRDAQALDDLAAYWGLPRGTLEAGEGVPYPQEGSADEGFDALKAVLEEYEMPLGTDTASPEGSRADRIDALYRSLEASEGSILDLEALRLKEHNDGNE